MSNLPPPPPPPPPGRSPGGRAPGPKPPERGGRKGFGAGWPRWTLPVMIAVLVAMIVLPQFWPSDEGDKVPYTEFIAMVEAGKVDNVTINNATGRISGETKDGDSFSTTGGGPRGISEADEE